VPSARFIASVNDDPRTATPYPAEVDMTAEGRRARREAKKAKAQPNMPLIAPGAKVGGWGICVRGETIRQEAMKGES
jgi:hypothetical protein